MHQFHASQNTVAPPVVNMKNGLIYGAAVALALSLAWDWRLVFLAVPA
jgi:hypothetical protein